MALNSVFVDASMMHPWPILESKGLRAIFQKKRQKKAEKYQRRANLKIWTKMYKI